MHVQPGNLKERAPCKFEPTTSTLAVTRHTGTIEPLGTPQETQVGVYVTSNYGGTYLVVVLSTKRGNTNISQLECIFIFYKIYTGNLKFKFLASVIGPEYYNGPS